LKQFEDSNNNNNSPYHRTIIDIGIPEMNGFDVARKAWSIKLNAQICFIPSFEINEKEAEKIFSNLNTYCFMTKRIMPSILAKHFQSHLSMANSLSPQLTV
jgi:two-component SAPR family response regulator